MFKKLEKKGLVVSSATLSTTLSNLEESFNKCLDKSLSNLEDSSNKRLDKSLSNLEDSFNKLLDKSHETLSTTLSTTLSDFEECINRLVLPFILYTLIYSELLQQTISYYLSVSHGLTFMPIL
jgi:predicted PurR-regulated permease PerM